MQLGTFTRALLCGSALISMSLPLQAEVTQLDVITITVNKIKQALSDVVGGVSVVTKKDTSLFGQQTVQQIVAGLPGVTGIQSANDPAQAINIRGLQDFGRVAVTVDGARQNFQRSGHAANGTFYFDPEQMQQVTVTRGPIANVYGSGAIGGVVSFESLDALSFLKPDEKMAGQEKLSYSTNGNKILSSTTGALRYGNYGGFLGNIVYRNAGDYVDGNGVTALSSGSEVKDALGKLTLTPGEDARIDIGYLVNNNTFHTPKIPPSGSQYENTVLTQTVSGKFNYKPKANQLIDFTASSYWTGTRQDQIISSITAPTNPLNVGRHREFMINTTGTDIYNTSRFDTGSAKHAFTVGADMFRDEVRVNDASTTPVAGRFTPSGNRTAGGAFVQDAIDVTSWLQFIVAGRYDAYGLDSATTNAQGSHFSPKGTLVLKPFENTSLRGLNFYGTYAEGYRAPAVTETLVNGIHPFGTQAPFTFLPNPNLRPEVSHNLEAGINGQWGNVFKADDRVTFRSSAYQNMVDDYIDSVYTDTNGDTVSGNIFSYLDDTYQYVNVARAKLRGIEAEFGYDSQFLFGGVAASMVRGTNDLNGTNLASIPADKVVTTLGFHFDDQKGSIGARWLAVSGQTLTPPPSAASTAAVARSDAYDVINLFANYSVNSNLNIALNVDNVFNTYYRPYMDTNFAMGRSVMLTVTTRLGK